MANVRSRIRFPIQSAPVSVFHTHNVVTHTLFHTQSCHKPSFTYHFVTHSLSQTTLSQTLFHIQLCQKQYITSRFASLCHTIYFTHNFVTPYFTHNLVTHTLFHTTLSQTIFHIPHHFVTHTHRHTGALELGYRQTSLLDTWLLRVELVILYLFLKSAENNSGGRSKGALQTMIMVSGSGSLEGRLPDPRAVGHGSR